MRLLKNADQLLDGCDSRDRLFGEGKGKRHGPDQAAINVNGAPAHAAHHAGFVQRATGKPGQNGVLAGGDVLQDSQHFGFKFLNLSASKNGFANPLHARLYLIQRQEIASFFRRVSLQ